MQPTEHREDEKILKNNLKPEARIGYITSLTILDLERPRS